MDADLVCASRLQATLDKCIYPEAFQDAVMRDCVAPLLRVDAHFFAIRRMASNRRMDSALILAQIAKYDGIIHAGDRMHLELFCERIVGEIILAYYQHAGCVHIDPVDNPRTHDSVDAGELILAMIHQRIDQSPGIMPCRWMDNHPLRLID